MQGRTGQKDPLNENEVMEHHVSYGRSSGMAGGVEDLYSLLKFDLKRHLMGQSGETAQNETEDGNIGRRQEAETSKRNFFWLYLLALKINSLRVHSRNTLGLFSCES